jgi:hypothetical protein
MKVLGYSIRDRAGDRIVAYFASGLKVKGDVLIGVDELRSRVRTFILGNELPSVDLNF